MIEFLIYWLQLLGGTLGTLVACGLLVHVIFRMFSRLIGSRLRGWFYVTSIIGTPVHELGHAIMCKLFFHRITAMRLWIPKPTNGVYGYVEHSYSRKNPWAKFGNLFIGMGPLFSGLGIIVLCLGLCFPTLWGDYLAHTSELMPQDGGLLPLEEIARGVLLLLKGIPNAFRADWLKSAVGLLVILFVALHISLSPLDIKSSLGALPIYMLLLALVACATVRTPAATAVPEWLLLINLRLIALFALVIGFALVWLAFAAVVRFIRLFISWF